MNYTKVACRSRVRLCADFVREACRVMFIHLVRCFAGIWTDLQGSSTDSQLVLWPIHALISQIDRVLCRRDWIKSCYILYYFWESPGHLQLGVTWMYPDTKPHPYVYNVGRSCVSLTSCAVSAQHLGFPIFVCRIMSWVSAENIKQTLDCTQRDNFNPAALSLGPDCTGFPTNVESLSIYILLYMGIRSKNSTLEMFWKLEFLSNKPVHIPHMHKVNMSTSLLLQLPAKQHLSCCYTTAIQGNWSVPGFFLFVYIPVALEISNFTQPCTCNGDIFLPFCVGVLIISQLRQFSLFQASMWNYIT